MNGSGTKRKEVLSSALVDVDAHGEIGLESRDPVQQPGGGDAGVGPCRASGHDLSSSFVDQAFDAGDNRRRVDEEKMIRPLDDGFDISLLRVAGAVGESLGQIEGSPSFGFGLAIGHPSVDARAAIVVD